MGGDLQSGSWPGASFVHQVQEGGGPGTRPSQAPFLSQCCHPLLACLPWVSFLNPISPPLPCGLSLLVSVPLHLFLFVSVCLQLFVCPSVCPHTLSASLRAGLTPDVLEVPGEGPGTFPLSAPLTPRPRTTPIPGCILFQEISSRRSALREFGRGHTFPRAPRCLTV